MKTSRLFHFFLLATVATLPFSEMRFFVSGIPIYIPELSVIFASAVFFFTRCLSDSFTMQKVPRAIFIPVAMILAGLVSSLLIHGTTLAGLGILKSWFFFPLLFGWLLFQAISALESFGEKILRVWFSALSLTAIAALISFFQGNLTYDGRLSGWYLSPNHLAMFLFPGIFLGWYFIVETLDSRLRGNDKKRSFLFFVMIASWVTLCTTLYLTLSYTVIIASIFGFFTVLFLASKRSYFSHTVSITLCISIVSFFLFFQTHNQKFSDIVHLNERSSLVSRIMIWKASAKMIADHPISGIGPGNFQETYLAYQQYFRPYLEWAVPHPHNIFLMFWLSSGIVGLVGFLWLLFSLGTELLFFLKRPEKTPVGWALFGIFLVTILIGCLDTPLWKTDLAYSFWLLVCFTFTSAAKSHIRKQLKKEGI